MVNQATYSCALGMRLVHFLSCDLVPPISICAALCIVLVYVRVRVRACLALSTLGLPWRLFSESSRSVMPLLFKIVTK